MKKIIFLIALVIFFSGCEMRQHMPLSVTFTDISGALSTDHTIKIAFAEEKDYENYYVDILIKADKEVELTLFQEFAKNNDKVTLTVNENYVSLDEYKLFNLKQEQQDSMVGYGDVLATTLVINSSLNANLTLLAVIGEKQDGGFKSISQVSKEYNLNVLKHINQ